MLKSTSTFSTTSLVPIELATSKSTNKAKATAPKEEK